MASKLPRYPDCKIGLKQTAEFQVGEWSQCDGSGCGQRVRAVYCQSGQAQEGMATK